MKKVCNIVEDVTQTNFSQAISNKDKNRLKIDILCLSVALLCLVMGFIYKKLFPEQDIVLSLIYLIGILVISFPIFITALKGFFLNQIAASMEILVSIAILVAIVDGQYILAILIPVILTVVHFLEEKSIMGGRDAVESLKMIQATSAILLEGEQESVVDVKLLQVDDIILIKPGMAFPIDGVVIDGISSINQQSLTGESTPVNVALGDKVFAGTLNIDGVIRVKVEKQYKDTSFQKIVDLLEKTQSISIPETRIVDRFMALYIPFTLILAVLVAFFTQDIGRAIAILVVSCPCGHMLVSSAPLIASFAAASKRGIIIKNSSFIEKLGNIKMLIFDKTGTVTKGTMEAVYFHLIGAKNKEELIKTAALVAKNSLHPVSKSIVALLDKKELDLSYEVKELIGKGMIGKSKRNEILMGSHQWISSLGYELSDEFEERGACSWVVKNKKLLGAIIFKDTPRDDARESIAKLKAMGITETVLLTGDNFSVASQIQEEVGLDSMFCKMLPNDKLEKVKEFQQQGRVAVIGDGINDALALAEADVGIAMGAMGSDTAIQSADIALMNNNLDNIPFAISLSRKTRSVILQNIGIAFFTSFIMLILASTGVVSAIMGAFLHNLGAFIVLANSGRILKKIK